MEAKDKGKSLRTHLFNLLQEVKPIVEDPNWKHFKCSDSGWDMYRLKRPDSKYTYNMAEKLVPKENISPCGFIKWIQRISIDKQHHETVVKCDPDNTYYNLVETVKYKEEEYYVVHFRYNSRSYFVKDRDFVSCESTFSHSNGKKCVRIGGSIDHLKFSSEYPVDKECVRAAVRIYAYSCVEKENDQLKIQYFTHTDPNGYIPGFVYNRRTVGNTMCISRYYEQYVQHLNEELDKMILDSLEGKKKGKGNEKDGDKGKNKKQEGDEMMSEESEDGKFEFISDGSSSSSPHVLDIEIV